jgi:hypothetical protein
MITNQSIFNPHSDVITQSATNQHLNSTSASHSVLIDRPLIELIESLAREAAFRTSLFGKFYSFIFGNRNYTAEINQTLTLLTKHNSTEDICNIFYNTLAKFDAHEFRRDQIPAPLLDTLKQNIPGSSVYKTAMVSLRLGILPRKNKGANASKIYCDLSQTPIAVFKPGTWDLITKLRKAKRAFLRCMHNQRHQTDFLSFPDEPSKGGILSERATYLLLQKVKADIVPTTEIVEIDGVTGSFQYFVSDHNEAKESHIPTLSEANEQDKTAFQIFAVSDYTIGNLDRKEDNWLVKLDAEGHIESIKMIDNANSFPLCHLPRHAENALSHQYLWKRLDLARAPLTADAKEFIKGLTDNVIDDYIRTLRQEFNNPAHAAFVSEPMITALRDRVKILKTFLEGERTLADLAQINTHQAITAALELG